MTHQPAWHLINGTAGNMICIFADEQKARKWLKKQIDEFPNGYFTENKVRIERFPPLSIQEGQVDIFELLQAI